MPTPCETFSHQIQRDVERLVQMYLDRVTAEKLDFPTEKFERSIKELEAAIEVRLAVMKEEEGSE